MNPYFSVELTENYLNNAFAEIQGYLPLKPEYYNESEKQLFIHIIESAFEEYINDIFRYESGKIDTMTFDKFFFDKIHRTDNELNKLLEKYYEEVELTNDRICFTGLTAETLKNMGADAV